MSDREKLAEIMALAGCTARGIMNECDPEPCPTPCKWCLVAAEAGIDAAERSGWLFVAPPDGR